MYFLMVVVNMVVSTCVQLIVWTNSSCRVRR